MLTNFDELKNYTEELAKQFPRIASTLLIGGKGLTTSEADMLNLPPVYKRCICDLGLFGVSIGYFSLWPGSIRDNDMIDSIRQANTGDEHGKTDASNLNLLIVGKEEANLICIGAVNSSCPDVVYLLDIMRSDRVEKKDIAPNFESFLLLAGNLHEISCKFEDEVDVGIDKMLECCDYFHCSAAQKAFWKSRAEVMLS